MAPHYTIKSYQYTTNKNKNAPCGTGMVLPYLFLPVLGRRHPRYQPSSHPHPHPRRRPTRTANTSPAAPITARHHAPYGRRAQRRQRVASTSSSSSSISPLPFWRPSLPRRRCVDHASAAFIDALCPTFVRGDRRCYPLVSVISPSGSTRTVASTPETVELPPPATAIAAHGVVTNRRRGCADQARRRRRPTPPTGGPPPTTFPRRGGGREWGNPPVASPRASFCATLSTSRLILASGGSRYAVIARFSPGQRHASAAPAPAPAVSLHRGTRCSGDRSRRAPSPGFARRGR